MSGVKLGLISARLTKRGEKFSRLVGQHAGTHDMDEVFDALDKYEHLRGDGDSLHVEFRALDLRDVFGPPLCGDGCSWGPSELYEENEMLLKAVLEHSIEKWDTGWFGCKKAIASFRAIRHDGGILCKASCSDDFDTEGLGDVPLELIEGETHDDLYERILEGLGRAWELADEDRGDSAGYAGYSIHAVGPDGESEGWYETLILPVGEFSDPDGCPPGDNYHKWMWQDEADPALPEDLKERMEEWAWGYHYGPPGTTRHAFFRSEQAWKPNPAGHSTHWWCILAWAAEDTPMPISVCKEARSEG